MPLRLPDAPREYNQRDQIELRRILESLSAQVSDLASNTSTVRILDEGTPLGGINQINFTGSGITATTQGQTATVAVAGGGAGVDTQDEGVFIGTATTLNFTGAGVTASFGAGTTTVNVPGGGSITVTETEVDFGSKPVYTAQFTVADGSIGAGSKVLISESGKAATGRVAGDAEWDSIAVAANPGAGTMTVYATAHPGPVVGKRKLHYLVS